MSAPHTLIEFFQQEAMEYLGRLDQMMADADEQTPDAAAFLTNARALRGSATMTRLDGLPDLASTIERIATGLRDNELRWDQRLHFAVRGALVELRSLVERAGVWTDAEQRRSRTHSVALAAVAAGYLATDTPSDSPAASPATRVVPISRFFPDDGMPAILQRNAEPPITLAQRFRADIAAAADGVARESAALATSAADPSPRALTDGVRRSLLGLAAVAESYGAASIANMATRMARAPLASAHERQGVQSVARLLMDREITDQHLAQQVKQASLTWFGAPAPGQTVSPAVIPIESLLYRGHSAIRRARTVRDELKTHWQRGTLAEPTAQALFEELSDLLDLAVTT
jgi:chemotaxis protein histidine kinase CheA